MTGKKSKVIRSICSILVLFFIFPQGILLAEGKVQANGGLADVISLGVEEDENNHHVKANGKSTNAEIHTAAGEIEEVFKVRTLEQKGASFSFEFQINPNQPLLLEVQEIHNRQEAVMAYEVLVENKQVYFRTYEQTSSGPNHYFIQVDEAVTGGKDRVKVAFKNEGSSTVNIGRVWAYSDFEALTAEENVFRKMLVGPDITFIVNWKDFSYTLGKLLEMKRNFGENEKFELGYFIQVYYAGATIDEIHKRIDFLLKLAEQSELPAIIQFDSWWGGTPKAGPDGLGGYWGDVKYQQITYDKGKFGLTVPNVWGNTPWMTMNNDHYNQFKTERLKKHLAYLTEKIYELKADGRKLPRIISGTDSEPNYWSTKMIGTTIDSLADFNPAAVQDAMAEGVVLNPEDGLSAEEREWLYRNSTRYVGLIADAMREGAGYDPILVSGEGYRLPETQQMENLFSQFMADWPYPFRDVRKNTWENALVKGGRYGGMWDGIVDPRQLEYQIARGRTANTNYIAVADKGLTGLNHGYAYGLDNIFIFQFRDKFEQHFSDLNELAAYEQRVQPVEYGNLLFRHDFDSEEDLNAEEISVQGLQRVAVGGEWCLVPQTSGQPGEIVYHLTGEEDIFEHGLFLTWKGRAVNFGSMNDPGANVKIYAGRSLEEMKEVQVTSGVTKMEQFRRVDLSTVSEGAEEMYVKLQLNASGLADWTAVSEVSLEQPFKHRSGNTNGYVFTDKEKRIQNLWVSYRADAIRLLGDYAARTGGMEDSVYTKAEWLFEEGKYASAYRLIVGEISQLLPAKFTIKGQGQLGIYPVYVELEESSNVVRAVLTEWNVERTELELESDQAQSLIIRLSSLQPGDHYRLAHMDGNRYAIDKTGSGETGAIPVSPEGVVEFGAALTAETKPQLPHEFTGKLLGFSEENGKKQIHFTSQDPAFDRAVSATLPLADDPLISRDKAGAAEHEMVVVPFGIGLKGDKIRVSVNDENEAASIQMHYGEDSGKIAAVQNTSPTSNGSVTLDNGRTYDFDLFTEFSTKLQTGTQGSIPMGEIKLKPGEAVQVQYSPYDNRVIKVSSVFKDVLYEDFENDALWKQRAMEYQNVKSVSLWSPAYPEKGLISENPGEPGYVMYRLESEGDAFEELVAEYSGRAIIDPRNRISLYAGTDPQQLTLLDTMETGWGDWNTPRLADVTDIARGSKTVYIKIELFTNNDTWGFLDDIRFKVNVE